MPAERDGDQDGSRGDAGDGSRGNDRGKRPDDSLSQLGVGWTLTIEFLAYLALLGYVGHRLDGRYEWGGKGLAGGLMFALAAWIYRVLRLTRRMWK